MSGLSPVSQLFPLSEDRFVAWIDISGFKHLLKTNQYEALAVIQEFFKIGYWQLNPGQHPGLQAPGQELDGLFVSDCAIVWTKNACNQNNCVVQFQRILDIVKKINEEVMTSQVMKKSRIMLSTSIAYGQFFPIKKVEHEHIAKQMIFGQAYIDAYADNANHLAPGLCRIVTKNLPLDAAKALNGFIPVGDEFTFIGRDGEHTYFYWNCRTPADINAFRQIYRPTPNPDYSALYDILKGNRW
jgi:hypothetical protein